MKVVTDLHQHKLHQSNLKSQHSNEQQPAAQEEGDSCLLVPARMARVVV